ncbi:Hypothetical protein PHPALM_97 [Phytophthora palmivora]|uniref:Uncharacterized protein n=1 Tax=Phytophthora palmivora TaxID=4796 RepID=A0A2P4YVN9_9STRA|nr:Hypothetical protein PHPALM_97 [Phytophthora palmivora]
MSLNYLAHTNMRRARENFLKFLEDEEVEWKYLEACMQRENAALVLETLVDKFGMHMAFNKSTMPSAKPKKNPISSHKEFRDLCHDTRQTYKMWISHEAIRHHRETMNTIVAYSNLFAEAIDVIFASLAQRGLRRVGLNDITEWIATPTDDDDAPSDEEEWHAEEDLQGENVALPPQDSRSQAHQPQDVLPADWELTREPRENLNQTVIIKSNKERRRLVRKTYIEYEAVENNTLNKTEG